MRKISRVLLKTALGLGVAGIGLCIGGVAMGATITGFDLSRYGVNTTLIQPLRRLQSRPGQRAVMSGMRTGMKYPALNQQKQIRTKKFLRQIRLLIWNSL